MPMRIVFVPALALLLVLAAGCGGSSSKGPKPTVAGSSSNSSAPQNSGPGTIAFGTAYTGNKDSTSCRLHGVTSHFALGESIANRAVFFDSIKPRDATIEIVDSTGSLVFQQVGGNGPTANTLSRGGCDLSKVSAYATVLKHKSGAYTFKVLRTSDKKVEAQGTVTLDFTSSQTSSQASSAP